MQAKGWAVVDGGSIKVKTVSDTRRAAIVNFLITERALMVKSNDDDQYIERAWVELRRDALVLPVTIEVKTVEEVRPSCL